MSRAPRRQPATQRRSRSAPMPGASFAESAEEPRMISSDEKRELILAHAQARTSSGWGPGYYVAIAASCLVVVTGWWMTAGINLRTGVAPHDQLLEGLPRSMQGPGSASALIATTGTSAVTAAVNAALTPPAASSTVSGSDWFDEFWRQAAGATSTEAGTSPVKTTQTTSSNKKSIR